MAWLTAKEVTGRLGAPLFNWVQFCHVGWCCGWGGVYEHTCLSELYSLGPAPPPQRPSAQVPPPSALGSQVGRLFGGLGHSCPCRGDLELCTCQYWGVVPTVTSMMRLLLYLPYRSLLRSPKHYYLFSLCLHPYYCQHSKWFLEAYRCGFGLLVMRIHVLILKYIKLKCILIFQKHIL